MSMLPAENRLFTSHWAFVINRLVNVKLSEPIKNIVSNSVFSEKAWPCEEVLSVESSGRVKSVIAGRKTSRDGHASLSA